MLLLFGFVFVLASAIGGFMLAGGNPMSLMHPSEFVTVGGISLGMLIIASNKPVMLGLVRDVKNCFQGDSNAEEEFMDLMKLLYELFMIGRRNGLIALDEHVTDPENSAIIGKYPSFLQHPERVEFLCNALRPIIDGKIKPEQLEELLDNEIYAKQMEAHEPVKVLNLIGDSLPGIGICAAIMGIINTLSAITDGPELVGKRVAAALTGTFLGVFGAYGFVNPLVLRVQTGHKTHFLYFTTMSQAVSGFAKGLAPLMAIEIARRSLETEVQPTADELEEILKAVGKKG